MAERAEIIISGKDQSAPAFQSAAKNVERFQAGLAGLEKSSRRAQFESQQLGYQIHDFAVQIASGQSPLTAFIQQGSQLSGTFGGAGNAFRAVLSTITPMRLALGGAAAAVGALAVAFYEGSKQSKEFAAALTLSGNYAGQSLGSITALSREIAKSGQISAGAAREAAGALAATGQVGPEVFAAATEAAARYQDATGKTAAEVAKDFASMSSDVSKFAIEHNRSLNFLSAAQLQQIKNFQDEGNVVAAQSIVYDALNVRLRSLEGNLGSLDRYLRDVSGTWKNFWDYAFDIGRPETIESKIASAQSALAKAQAANSSKNVFGISGRFSGEVASQQEILADALKAKLQRDTIVAATAATAELNKKGSEANVFVDGVLKRTKSVDELNKALTEARRRFADAEKAGTPVSGKDQSLVLAQIRKEHTAPKGPKSNEAEQVRRAALEADLKFLQDKQQQEADSISFHQRELSALYSAGTLSLRGFYDQRNSEIAAGVQRELNLLTDEQARLEVELGHVKDPSDRIKLQTQLDESIAKSGRVAVQAARSARLSNLEEAASFKALQESVAGFNANLAQMQGDENQAAAIRAEQSIRQARELAKQAQDSGQAPIDVAGFERSTIQANQITAAKRATSQINELLQQQEDRIGIAQRSGAISELEALSKIGDARAAIVGQMQTQVAELERLAKERPLDLQLNLDASRARLELDKLRAEIDPLKDKFDSLFRDSASSALGDFLDKTKSAKDALKDFGRSIASSVNRDVAKQLSGQLFGQGGQAEGAGGFLASLFGQRSASASAPRGGEQSILELFKDPAAQAGDLSSALGDTRKETENFSATLPVASQALSIMAGAGSLASRALSILPSIISAISTSSGGSSVGSFFSSLFGSGAGSGGATAGASSSDLAALFGSVGYGHNGGLAGYFNTLRNVDPSVFAGADRYHAGGLVGMMRQRMGLAHDEVPAILRKREEVLRTDDPRHRDNMDSGGADSSSAANVVNQFAITGPVDERSQRQIAAAAFEGASRAYRRTR